MNIKPTEQQVREWAEGAGKYADMKHKAWEAWDLLRDQKLAELAAKWGAAQAQQPTEPEAWSIPEWSKQDDLGGRVPSDVRVALNEAHRAGVRAGAAGSQDAKLKPTNPIYYIRDNHTFKELSNNVETALVEIEQCLNDGYTYGMLYSKRDGFKNVPANGAKHRLEFLYACRASLEAAMQGDKQ